MKLLILNILLAISWSALTGSSSLASFLVGFAVGYLALWVTRVRRHDDYFRRLPKVLALGLCFLRELVVGGVRTTREVVSPVRRSNPQVIRVPLALGDRGQVLVLSQLLSLTPGTLVLDIEDDALVVHTMFIDDAAAFRREISTGLERRVREAMS